MKFKKIPKKFLVISIIVLSIGGGFLFGFIYAGKSNVSAPESQKEISEVRENTSETKYQFINPLLECGEIENVSNKKSTRLN